MEDYENSKMGGTTRGKWGFLNAPSGGGGEECVGCS